MNRLVFRSIAPLGCAMVMLVTAAPAFAAPSGAAGVLSVAPAHPDPAVSVGKSYFVHTLVAGQSWTAQVAVTNTNPVAVDAWVDSVDGITSSRTGAVYTERSSSSKGTAAWLVPGVSSIIVPAHTVTQISFTVHVPLGASAGDHVAGIAFEDKRGAAAGARAGVGITTVLRSVVAVQINVPGPAVFLLHIFGATVGAAPTTGTTGIGIDMEDVGGLLGKPELEIVLDGPSGYQRFQTIKLDTMLPGDRINDELLWPDALAASDYTLSITEDGVGRQGVPYVTKVHLAGSLVPTKPGQPRSETPTVPSATGPIITPILAGAAGVATLLTIGGAAFFMLARRLRCLHCNRGFRRGRLMVVTHKDEMSGCMRCAIIIHNVGTGRFCGACARIHLRPAGGRHAAGPLISASAPNLPAVR